MQYRHKKLALALCFTFIVMGMSSVHATTPGVSTAIDRFVAKLFPKAINYYWIVNDSRVDTHNELIMDINTVVTEKPGETPTENRFLLLILHGKLIGAQSIPLDAKVDCRGEEEV